jgi:hypothetical protein
VVSAVLYLPGAPGVLRRHARGCVSVLDLCGLVDRDPGPDQITRRRGSHAAASAGRSPRRSFQSHRYEPRLPYANATPTLRRCAITAPRRP